MHKLNSQRCGRPSIKSGKLRGLLSAAACLRRLRRDDSGNVVILAGFVFPVLIGGMGLGAEAGLWYFTQRKVQHAADVASYSAGIRVLQGENRTTELVNVATHVAVESGFQPGTLFLDTPYNGRDDQVEVVLTETVPPLFSSIYRDKPLALSGRAVVEITQGQLACVLALSASGVGVRLGGTAHLRMNGCDVAANSTSSQALYMGGSSKLSTRCVHTAGQASTTTGMTLSECKGPNKDEVHEHAPRTVDPYAAVAEPEDQGNCEPVNFHPTKPNILTPYMQGHPSGLPTYRFCGDVNFKGEVVFGPGLYIFSGGRVSANAGATLAGVDVVFYLTNGAQLDFNGNATINLSARTEDPYSGILFFADREDTGISHTVNGGAGGQFGGAVYFPGGDVTYSGGATAGGGGCTQVIGYTVTFIGNSDVGADCTLAGTRDILADRGVRIIE